MLRISLLGSSLAASSLRTVALLPMVSRMMSGDAPRVCYRCGAADHMSFDCPQPRKERAPMAGGGDGSGGRGGFGGDSRPRGPTVCYNCQETGHMSFDCEWIEWRLSDSALC